MEKLIIDRFEGDTAVCEQADRRMTSIPRDALPPDVREGDVLYEEGGRYTIDREETATRAKRMRDRLNNLFK